MDRNQILIPVLAQVSLTIIVFAMLARAKAAAAARGEVDPERRALHDDAWPDSVLKISNNIRNQFETPVLFYVLALTIWGLDAVDVTALALAWAFFATRVVHVFVHTGANVVPIRRRVFTLGVATLLLLVIRAAVALA